MNPRKHSRQRRWQRKKRLAKRLQRYLRWAWDAPWIIVRARSKGNATTRLPFGYGDVKAFYGSAGE